MAAGGGKYPYDIFVSHNHADKAWVRRLALWLGEQEYNGRKLRPWLDEHFLDPGNPASNLELTTALDRSRLMGVVLSPEAVASGWVDLELRYAIESRGVEPIVAMLRRDCSIPTSLAAVPLLDFRAEAFDPEALQRLLARVCPPAGRRVDEVERAVDAAFDDVVASDPGGLGPGPTPQRDALFAELLRSDIDDSASEGLAVAGFMRAVKRVMDAPARSPHAAYNAKMLLGECLAGALARSPSYRQVARRFLDITRRSNTLIPLFVVARSLSKLAEIDPRLVDTSVLMRALSDLDAIPRTNEAHAVETLLGRVVGKLRDNPAGELLIKSLTGRGRASRATAAGAIGFSYQLSGPVFYLSELETLHEARGEERVLPAGPPSRRLLGELFSLDHDEDESVRTAAQNARDEIRSAYPGTDFPYGLLWFLQRETIEGVLQATPFIGTVVKATRENMIEVGERATVSTVACLTQSRIVDALFDGCGALLIETQDADSPQCRRLESRGMPFAMLSAEAMGRLADGDHVVVDEARMHVLGAAQRRTPTN
jgi:hypothetical protein